MNGDREKILARVREALTVPAPKRHEAPSRQPATPTVTAPFREWLPRVGETIDDQIALFGQMSAMLKADFKVCESVEQAAGKLVELANEGGWKRLGLHSGAIIDEVIKHLADSLEVVNTDAGYDKAVLETCDAGLTECETLVAQTGSICVTSLSSGGRALSALPPHHVVIARREQIVPDLPAAYERLAAKYGAAYPSFIGFITGPSRTGDIERILVLGAHGPKRLTILLVP